MGANEKKQAAFFGHTPNVEFIRGGYVYDRQAIGGVFREDAVNEFNRWLESIKADAKAEALEEAAADSQMGPVPYGWNASGIASWLRARAEQIREKR